MTVALSTVTQREVKMSVGDRAFYQTLAGLTGYVTLLESLSDEELMAIAKDDAPGSVGREAAPNSADGRAVEAV